MVLNDMRDDVRGDLRDARGAGRDYWWFAALLLVVLASSAVHSGNPEQLSANTTSPAP